MTTTTSASATATNNSNPAVAANENNDTTGGGGGGYQEPSAVLKRLFLPPKTPSLSLSSDCHWLIYTGTPPLPSIELLSRPEEKLAGLRFDPILLAPSRLDYCFDLHAQHLPLQQQHTHTAAASSSAAASAVAPEITNIPLPVGSEGIRYIRFNPNCPNYALQQFVFTSKRKKTNVLDLYICNLIADDDAGDKNENENENDGTDGGNNQEKHHHWVVHPVSAVRDRRLNFINGCAYQFTSDGTSLLCKVVPEKHPSAPPVAPSAPTGPVIHTVTEGAKKAPGRSYQDLLQNQHDEEKFRYYLTTELLQVELVNSSTNYETASLVTQSKGGCIPYSMESSPCGRYLLMESITTVSYSVPLSRFGKDVAVWDLLYDDDDDGDNNKKNTALIVPVVSNPVDDEIPLSFDACSRHKRDFQFHPLLPHTLLYAHALDGGDPTNDPVQGDDNDNDDDDEEKKLFRDAIYTQDIIPTALTTNDNDDDAASSFTTMAASLADPIQLCQLEWRYNDIQFTESGSAILIDEYRWSDRMERKWKIMLPPTSTTTSSNSTATSTSTSSVGASTHHNHNTTSNTNTKKSLVWERSWEDRYSSPGQPVQKRGRNGKYVIRELKSAPPGTIYLKGAGASTLGDRPFLDKMHLDTGVKERLWRCKAPTQGDLQPEEAVVPSSEVGGTRLLAPEEREDVYETLVVILDDDDTILLSRESKRTPTNYYLSSLSHTTTKKNLSSLSSSKRETKVTNFPHPQPDLIGVEKEIVQYQRQDGVVLTADLYLPPGYEQGTTAPRPTLFWAYPREFKNAKAAGQLQGSHHRFVSAHWASPIHWAAKGWVVMDDFSLPIIGEGDAHPNDTFIEQIVAGATAAVDYVTTTRGISNPAACVVGGHSYGSFMTAHLLSHTSLFAAGIGRSGAFNRTLTPMSFQAEDRSLWDAPDTYIAMSPLLHVKKYSEQARVGKLLLIHGAVDENSGTHTMQSERYFAALKAFGIESRLCLLPHERHSYRAKESILHMAWEQEAWLTPFEEED